MRRRPIVSLLVGLTLGGASTAVAQDPGQVGLTMGYPAGVGLLIHVSDAIAIRPEFTFTTTSTETDVNLIVPGPGPSETETWNLGAGISALFYLNSGDNLRTYISPRFLYSRLSGDNSTPSGLGGGTLGSRLSGSAISVSGSFGAHYSLGRRFSVFGEIGLAYSDTDTTQESTSSSVPFPLRTTSKTTGFGIRSGAGVILYF